jgi:hypothetical protein
MGASTDRHNLRVSSVPAIVVIDLNSIARLILAGNSV